MMTLGKEHRVHIWSLSLLGRLCCSDAARIGRQVLDEVVIILASSTEVSAAHHIP